MAQESYHTLINTSSKTVKQDGKILSLRGLTTKGIWYDSAEPSQNVQDIRRSHKLYQESHGNLENGTDSRRKKLS